MIITVILICFVVLVYMLLQILDEVVKIRADVEFLKDTRTAALAKEILKDYLSKDDVSFNELLKQQYEKCKNLETKK